jgi:hypothetical protein
MPPHPLTMPPHPLITITMPLCSLKVGRGDPLVRGISAAARGQGKHSALRGADEPAGGGRGGGEEEDIILGADNWPILKYWRERVGL